MVQSPPSTVPTESISLSHTKKSTRIFIKSSATNLLDIYSFPVMLADLQLKSNICIRNCQTSYYIFGIFQTKSVRPTSHVRASDWTVGLPTLLSTSTSWKKTLNYHYIMIHIGWLSTAFLLSSKTLYLRSKFPLSFVASSEKFNILLYMPMCPVTFQISVYFVRIFLRISSAF